MFTWIPLYNEIARKVLEFESRQGELLAMLRGFHARGLKMYELRDKLADDSRTDLTVIDPFTFFAAFNRAMTDENRRAVLRAIREEWNLSAAVPDDFNGIPCLTPQNAWFFSYSPKRQANDLPLLWQLARTAVEKKRAEFPGDLLNSGFNIRACGLSKLTIGLYWLNPTEYLAAAKTNVEFAERAGIASPREDAASYFDWMDRVSAKMQMEFPALSRAAYVERLAAAENGGTEGADDTEAIVREDPTPASRPRRYWWLNANPKIWDFRNLAVGAWQTYTSYNEKGNKRQKFRYFGEVEPGDLLVGYLTTPDKEVVAICEITKALHESAEGEAFEFKKIEQVEQPITWAELQTVASLAECEPIKSNQGSLFALTEDEFDAIRALIDERNPVTVPPERRAFSKADALDDLFMSAAELDAILARLTRKKGIILQGPPGVGKTFVACRLAYAQMGERDDSRVCMVQFHPSYGYEDFIQGYRPDGTGLRLRNGVFYEFARRARHDGRPCFFIIDEINRGNLAKIFGELLMLLEADKRGPQFAMPLTYADTAEETFWLPENLHVIGTMNTADRSLAMVDYALRRRFAFATLDPALHRTEFRTWLAAKGAPASLTDRIADRVGRLNDEISAERDLGPGFRIGHSYFCPTAAPSDWDAWYRDVIDAEVGPLLEEYFDKPARVQELKAALLA